MGLVKNASVAKSDYRCTQCRARARGYTGRCPVCGMFTMVMVDRQFAPEAGKADFITLDKAKPPNRNRMSTGFENFDEVMGGMRTPGIRVPAVVMFGAPPGCGKSTVLLEMMVRSPQKNSLYVAVEESADDLRDRAERFDFGDRLSEIRVKHERNFSEIMRSIRKNDVKFVILDSLGELEDPENDVRDPAANYFRYVASCFDEAHDHGRVFVLVSHLNSDGQFFGALKVQHKVDTLIFMEQIGDTEYRRVLAPSKNRGGPTGPKTAAYFHMMETGMKAITRAEGEMIQEQLAQDAIAARLENLREAKASKEGE